MNDFDTEFLLNKIFVGSLLFYFQNELYELKYASNQIKYQANLIYDNIINEERFNDWIREENMIYYMISADLWTYQTDSLIKQLEKKIEDYKVDLFKACLSKDKQKPIRKQLNNSKQNLNNTLAKKQEFLAHTLEGYALSIKNEYVICNTLYKNNKKVFDNNTNDFKSYSYFNDIVNEINKYTITIEQFKSLARSGIWRSYWNANKTNIFSSQVIDWTDDQRTLVNISKMYDNIYENPDCPSDDVINDDDMLDGWMILQRKKSEQDKKTKTFDDLNPHVKNAGEVFVMTQGSQGYEEVISMNTPETLRRQQEKFEFIQKNKVVQENQLPDVKRDLAAKSAEMLSNHRK
jgi:hypothetical protein